MPVFGILSVLFGVIVIAYPDFIAYIIGFFFIFVGFNMILVSLMLRRGSSAEKNSWKVGGYEIIRNRK